MVSLFSKVLRQSFQEMVLEKLDSHMQQNGVDPIPHNVYKN